MKKINILSTLAIASLAMMPDVNEFAPHTEVVRHSKPKPQLTNKQKKSRAKAKLARKSRKTNRK